MKAKLANVISLLIGLVVCCTLLPKAQAGCSVHDHLCSYHAIGQITTPAIEKQLGEDSSQGQFSESGLYVVSAWKGNASNQSADLDLEVLLPEKALNEDPRSNQFLLPTYSDTGPYVIRSVGYPPDGNPFEGIDAEAPRHVGTDQYDITFMNNTARAIHSEDANGANIIRNEPAVRPCKITKNCEFVQIKGNIPSGEYRGAVTNYDYHNLSDPSTPYYILGAYLSPDLEETGVIINRSHTNGAMVGTIEDPDQVSEQYVFDFYNRGFSHAKGANAYDDFTKNFYGKTKYADPYTYTSGIYDITVQNKYRDEWTNAYITTIGADASLSTTNNGTIARRNNVFIGADTSYAYTPAYLNYLAEVEAERQRQIDEDESQVFIGPKQPSDYNTPSTRTYQVTIDTYGEKDTNWFASKLFGKLYEVKSSETVTVNSLEKFKELTNNEIAKSKYYAAKAQKGLENFETGYNTASMIPVVGETWSTLEAWQGKDYVSGEKLSNIDRAIKIAEIIPAYGKGKKTIKLTELVNKRKSNVGNLEVVDKVKLTEKKVDLKLNTGKKGSNNPTVKKSIEIGQEAHRQIQTQIVKSDPNAKIEHPLRVTDSNGKIKSVRKDAVLCDGTCVIIKPDTKSGRYSAKKRNKLMQDNDYKTKVILYDPKNPAYEKGSPTYIGPKK